MPQVQLVQRAGSPPVHGVDLEARAELPRHLQDLLRELARRHEDEGLDLVGIGVQRLDEREEEGQRLPGARRGEQHDVPAGAQGLAGLALHGVELGDVELAEVGHGGRVRGESGRSVSGRARKTQAPYTARVQGACFATP